ncbi:hypothetical protein LINPERPRIM_LOCUS5670 [Linum perenne]
MKLKTGCRRRSCFRRGRGRLGNVADRVEGELGDSGRVRGAVIEEAETTQKEWAIKIQTRGLPMKQLVLLAKNISNTKSVQSFPSVGPYQRKPGHPQTGG